MRVVFEVDDRSLMSAVRVLGMATGNYRRPLALFQNYMRTVTVRHFQALAQGGTHRGVYWPYFSPHYTVRPSGQRVRPGDAVLQDTRRLLRSVTSQIDYQIAGDTFLTWGTRLRYAAEQDARRPFLFFAEQDVAKLERLLEKHLMGG